MGEVDVIARQGEAIVFVEVKTRASSEHGEPWQAVDRRKRRQVTRVAVQYLKTHRLLDHPVRFDIIAITWPAGWFRRPHIEPFPDAFPAEGPWST